MNLLQLLQTVTTTLQLCTIWLTSNANITQKIKSIIYKTNHSWQNMTSLIFWKCMEPRFNLVWKFNDHFYTLFWLHPSWVMEPIYYIHFCHVMVLQSVRYEGKWISNRFGWCLCNLQTLMDYELSKRIPTPEFWTKHHAVDWKRFHWSALWFLKHELEQFTGQNHLISPKRICYTTIYQP